MYVVHAHLNDSSVIFVMQLADRISIITEAFLFYVLFTLRFNLFWTTRLASGFRDTIRALPFGKALFFRKVEIVVQNEKQDILYQAAYVWKELMSYRYVLTYGYKEHLHTINLTFLLVPPYSVGK